MKISIITAMPGETQAIVRMLQPAQKMRTGAFTVYQAQRCGHDVIVAEAGMGFDNATKAARLLMGELRPALMISAGFCGGISAELQVGDAVVASQLTIVSEGGLKEVPVTISTICRDVVSLQGDEGQRVFAGLFVSTTAIMQKGALAALLPPDAHCPVVEMESATIALEASENGIPFIGLRTVSDPFGEELGFTLDEFCDQRMRIRIAKVLLTVARKPRIIPQLLRLASNSRVAAASLSRTMKSLLDHL